MIIVLNQFLPLVLSRLTVGRLHKMVNKPARDLRVPAKVWDLARHQRKMLTAMVGPKLEDTESIAVIHQACTELCSRCERHNLNQIKAGSFFFLFFLIAVSMFSIIVHIFSRNCICSTKVLKTVCDPCTSGHFSILPLHLLINLSQSPVKSGDQCMLYTWLPMDWGVFGWWWYIATLHIRLFRRSCFQPS